MKTLFTTSLMLLAGINLFQAQNQPTKCDHPASSFDDMMKGKITSQVRTAHQYFMNSPDPNAGNTYGQRTENLQREIARTFQAFMNIRKEEYKKTVCFYYDQDWNKPGNSSNRTLTVQPGFYLLTNTLKRTTDGDWKGGPVWAPNETSPTSITWKTGGHGKSNTFVDIQAMYADDHTKKTIINELNTARKELNDLGIPTEIPPFLDE